MAEVSEVQLDDIQEFTFAGDTYVGITSMQITVRQGRLRPVRFEGEMIGSAVEREADEGRFPVEFRIQSNSAAVEAQLAQVAESGEITFTARERGSGGTRKTYELSGAMIGEAQGSVSTRYQEGQHGVQGVAATFAEVTI